MDREAGVCGVFGTQVHNGPDADVKALNKIWEETIYNAVKVEA